MEAAVLGKINRRLIPFLMLLYLVAYLDRVNIGFAALEMNHELGFSDAVFGFGAGIFFIGYFLLEVPSNLILERVGARFWIARIMITWGAISAAEAFMKDAPTFYTLRFLLGVAEAGFFPGIILYLTYWYPPRQHAQAVARFMTAIPAAGVLGSLISAPLLQMHGILGLSGWQWLLLLQGLPAVILGFVVFARLPDGPQNVQWLAPEEKQWLQDALEQDRSRRRPVHIPLWRMCLSPTLTHLSGIYFFLVGAMFSYSVWLPQVLEAWVGAGPTRICAISAVAMAVAVGLAVKIGISSDRTKEHRWHLALPSLAAALGLTAAALVPWPAVSLVLVCTLAPGVMAYFGPFWSFTVSRLTKETSAGGIAYVNSVGNLGAFAAPYAAGLLRGCSHNTAAPLYTMAAFSMMAALLALMVRDKQCSMDE